MTGWWTGRTLRERLLVGAVLPTALILLGYQYGWRPVDAARTVSQAEIAAYRQVIAAAAMAGTVATPAPREANPVPMDARVTQSADAAGLPIRRLEPEAGGLRVTLDDAAFGDVILWISDLELAQDLRVAAVEFDRRTEPGTVTTRLLLEPME